MSGYQRYRAKKERPWKIHPVWRGIGCIWLIILPIMAYAGAWTFTRENFTNRWLPLNETLASQVRLPVIDWPFLTFPIDLNYLIGWIPGQPLYNADILFFGAFLFLGIGIMSAVYAFIYRSVAPMRGPFDAPEVESQRRRKRY
jgi:hypothetical protein